VKSLKDNPVYWTDPTQSEFEVSIGSVKKLDECFHIRIKENVIRPAGGGQAGDKGLLIVGDLRVSISDTISDSVGVFLITDEPLTEGAVGHLEIDMDWRSSMMRNHTAEHLFVAFIKQKISDIDVGELWIDGKHGSVEIVGAELDFETIFEAESEVMKVIEEDLPVKTSLVDSKTIDQSVRSREGLTEKHDQLRIVSVGDMDSSACSGIHVSRTRDIGFFKVLDVKKGENTTRVEFASGLQTARLVSTLYNEALRRKFTYPYEMEQLGAVLDRAKSAVDDRQKMIEKTSQLLTNGSTIETIAEVNFRHEYLPGYDANSLRILSSQIPTTESSILLLFAPGRKSQVILRTDGMPKDASEYISKPMQKLGGRGGGKGEVFTGGFVDIDNPVKLYEDLVTEVRALIS
jgi:alanyl-tRNA synthetase